ncbi:MAG: hypothetical protein GKR97_11125 [Rhizobiaceae bacterium]|nr:hypothetical protein [Rhizobiaceae bacterium]
MSFENDCQKLFDSYVSHYRVGDAAGCSSAFAAEAQLYSPYGAPAIGRPAIEATHKEWLADGGEDKQISVLSSGCSGDLGWCLAQFSEVDADSGTSLNVLERQADGEWLITRCSLNDAS